MNDTEIASYANSNMPTTPGQAVTFTATVAGAEGGTPTGTMTFMDGNSVLETDTLSAATSGAQATFTTATLADGTHTITAVYSGDSTFAAGTSAILNQFVSNGTTASSSVTLSSSSLQATTGQVVTFTATVDGVDGGTPTGTVSFEDGSTVLGTAALSAGSSGAQASFSTSALAAGTHAITAVYNGDSNYAASTSLALSESIQAGSSSNPGSGSMTPSMDSTGSNGSSSASTNVANLLASATTAAAGVSTQLSTVAAASSGGAVMATNSATSSGNNAATPPGGPLNATSYNLNITSGSYQKHYTEWGSNGSASFYLDVNVRSTFTLAGESGSIIYTANLEVGGVSVVDETNVAVAYSYPTIVAGGTTLGNLPIGGEIAGFTPADFGFDFLSWDQMHYRETDSFNPAGTYRAANGVNYSFNQNSSTSSQWDSVLASTGSSAVNTNQFGNSWNYNLSASDSTANFTANLSAAPAGGTTYLAQVTNAGSSSGFSITTNSVVGGQIGTLGQSVWSIANNGVAGSRYYYNNKATVPGSSSGNSDAVTWDINQQSTNSYGGSQVGNLSYSGSSPSGSVTTTSKSGGQSASNSNMSDAYQVSGGSTQGGGLYKTSSSLTLSYNGQATEQQNYTAGTRTADTVNYSNSNSGNSSQAVSNEDNYTTQAWLGTGTTTGSDAYLSSVQGQSQGSQSGTNNLVTNTSTLDSTSSSTSSGSTVAASTSDYASSGGSSSSNNTTLSSAQGNAVSYYALAGGFNASGAQTSGSSVTYNGDGGSYQNFQSSQTASAGYPTSTYQQQVTGTYGDGETDTAWANGDGSVSGNVQANSTSSQVTDTSNSLIGTQKQSYGTAVYNDTATNTDTATNSVTTNLNVLPSGAQYGTIAGVATDNSSGNYQLYVKTDSILNGFHSLQIAAGANVASMTDTETSSFNGNNLPTTTDTLDTTEGGSSSQAVASQGIVADTSGHTGYWTFNENAAGNLASTTIVSWLQVGNGNWTVTGSWFSISTSGNSSYGYHELDDGLNAYLLPGESGTFYNSVNDTGNASQSQTEIGTPNNFAFTFQLNQNGSQKTVNNSVVTFAALDMTSTSNASSSKTSISDVTEAGRQVNGLSILSNVNLFQSVASLGSQDGSSTSPQGQSSGHSRWSNTVVVWLQGNSAAGKGRQTTMVWSSAWGNSATTGPWGNQAGMGSTLPPVDLSWPVKSPMPPPPPPPPPPPLSPTSGGMTTNFFNAIPNNGNGGDELGRLEAKFKRDQQLEARGITPPPLTSGSGAFYGSDGNRTAQEAMVEAGQAIQGMSQMAILPLKFLPGIGQVAVLAGSLMDLIQGNYLNAALGASSVLNPCGLLTKGLAGLSLYNNVSDVIQNGVNLSNGSGMVLDMLSLFGACFTGDMLVAVEGGKKRADAIAEGDKLWSRNEFDPDGPLMLKVVEECFVRVSLVLNLQVGGQLLRTTGEHPFWVQNRLRWLPARELKVGDLLRTRCGSLVAVEGLEDSGQVETVYNWRIADYHTYYVSATEDGVSVWAHNASYLSNDKSISGKSPSRILGDRPRGWTAQPPRTGRGYVLVDENGVARIRYMRPNSNGKFYHQKTGYFRRQNANGDFLDIDGNVVDPNNPFFNQLTHIIPNGV